MIPFPTTRWNLIAEAVDGGTPEFSRAFSDLCASYWYPVYALIRLRGYAPEDAADLTQDFFARLLGGKLLGVADQTKGRFRDLIWRDCQFFLGDARDRAGARKRSAKQAEVSLDYASAEQRYVMEPSNRLDPEQLFERAWALGVIERSLERLRVQEESAGRGPGFRLLGPLLTEDSRAPTAVAVAKRLGSTEGALRAALRRLRVRYREALREEVASTLGEPDEAEVDEELRHLLTVLGR